MVLREGQPESGPLSDAQIMELARSGNLDRTTSCGTPASRNGSRLRRSLGCWCLHLYLELSLGKRPCLERLRP